MLYECQILCHSHESRVARFAQATGRRSNCLDRMVLQQSTIRLRSAIVLSGATKPFSKDSDRSPNFPPCPVANTPQSQQPPQGDSQQVFDRENICSVKRIWWLRVPSPSWECEYRMWPNRAGDEFRFRLRDRTEVPFRRCRQNNHARRRASDGRCRTDPRDFDETLSGRIRSSYHVTTHRTDLRRWWLRNRDVTGHYRRRPVLNIVWPGCQLKQSDGCGITLSIQIPAFVLSQWQERIEITGRSRSKILCGTRDSEKSNNTGQFVATLHLADGKLSG